MRVAAVVRTEVPKDVDIQRIRRKRSFRIVQMDVFRDDLQLGFVLDDPVRWNGKITVPYGLRRSILESPVRCVLESDETTC